MSLMRCEKHDHTYDSDVQECVWCINELVDGEIEDAQASHNSALSE